MALNNNIEAFVMHVTYLSFNKLTMSIYPAKEVQIALLITKKIKIPVKYSNFSNVFLKEKALVLQKIIKLN